MEGALPDSQRESNTFLLHPAIPLGHAISRIVCPHAAQKLRNDPLSSRLRNPQFGGSFPLYKSPKNEHTSSLCLTKFTKKLY